LIFVFPLHAGAASPMIGADMVVGYLKDGKPQVRVCRVSNLSRKGFGFLGFGSRGWTWGSTAESLSSSTCSSLPSSRSHLTAAHVLPSLPSLSAGGAFCGRLTPAALGRHGGDNPVCPTAKRQVRYDSELLLFPCLSLNLPVARHVCTHMAVVPPLHNTIPHKPAAPVQPLCMCIPARLVRI
jgi:hypothetical protein